MEVPLQPKEDKKLNRLGGKRDEAKGGRSMTPFGTLSFVLAKRTKCNPKCMFFENCPVSAVAVSYKDPKTGEIGKCLMKEFPETVKVQFVNMFLTGEEGIIRAIKTALHNYMVDVDAFGSLKDKKDMIQLMLQFYKEVYNTSRSAGKAKEPLTITIRRVGIAPETITVRANECLPEGVSGKDLIAERNDDITEGDPESLVNSPLFDRIVRREVRMEEIKIETNMESIMGEEDD